MLRPTTTDRSALADGQDWARLPAAFSQPVQQAQQVFRAALQALSRPGLAQPLPPALLAELSARLAPTLSPTPTLAALMLSLLDADTALWLSPALDHAALRGWLRLHAGVACTDALPRADFAALRAHELTPALWAQPARGDDESPQQSATLLIELPTGEGSGEGVGADTLTDADTDAAAAAVTAAPVPRCRLTLCGPGIQGQLTLAVCGIDPAVWRARQAEAADFPRGLDLLLCRGPALLGLPRSTRLLAVDDLNG